MTSTGSGSSFYFETACTEHMTSHVRPVLNNTPLCGPFLTLTDQKVIK